MRIKHIPVRGIGSRPASVKDYHRDDIAVQAFLARAAGVALKSVVHVDSSWVYPGGDDYRGLLKENDLTAEAFARDREVGAWIADAQGVVAQPDEPDIRPGIHCATPFECGFHRYCSRDEVKPEYPIHWLPRFSAAAREALAALGVHDMRDVGNETLSDKQLRVKEHTLTNTVFFDAAGAASDLAVHCLPAYFLDFETIQFAVPIWKGTRPYQQIVFQFSVHRLDQSGRLTHTAFLDVSGNDPSSSVVLALVAACGECGPIFAYSAGFEKSRIAALAERYPDLAPALMTILERVIDLLPVARERYYHPSQQGSWSIKRVLPAVVPELTYEALDGIKDGGMAMESFVEAIHANTTPQRRQEIERQLLEYCKLDTYAMVRLWQVFAGRADMEL